MAGRTKAGRRLQALWLVDREEWLVGSVATSRRGRWWLLIWSGGDPEEEEDGGSGGGRERMDGTSLLKTRVRLFK